MSSDTLGHVLALNFHVWQPCNMGCQYCFAEFSETVPRLQADKRLLRERALTVVESAGKAGIQKLTLVGGEPTLCPWLLDLLQLGKRLGMVTMVVSNGSRMSETWVTKHSPWTDWAALSIDSLDAGTNRSIGRAVGRAAPPDASTYGPLLTRLQRAGCRIKVNTVVSALNYQEDFTSFLLSHCVERWKVLQALHVSGENDGAFPHMAVSESQFTSFVERHQPLQDKLMLAPEDNDSMRGSYLMVDPLGRFFSNVHGGHRYSEPIWKVGWHEARSQVEVDAKKFIQRGGQYDWAPLILRR